MQIYPKKFEEGFSLKLEFNLKQNLREKKIDDKQWPVFLKNGQFTVSFYLFLSFQNSWQLANQCPI